MCVSICDAHALPFTLRIQEGTPNSQLTTHSSLQCCLWVLGLPAARAAVWGSPADPWRGAQCRGSRIQTAAPAAWRDASAAADSLLRMHSATIRLRRAVQPCRQRQALLCISAHSGRPGWLSEPCLCIWADARCATSTSVSHVQLRLLLCVPCCFLSRFTSRWAGWGPIHMAECSLPIAFASQNLATCLCSHGTSVPMQPQLLSCPCSPDIQPG